MPFHFDDTHVLPHIKFVKFEYSRNLHNHPFLLMSSEKSRKEVEVKIVNAIDTIQHSDVLRHGDYIRYSEDHHKYEKLLENNKIELSQKVGRNSPLIFASEHLIFIINDSCHLRIISTGHENVKKCYNNINAIHKALDDILNFEFDNHYGFLNSDITKLASGLSFYCELDLHDLSSSHHSEVIETFPHLSHGHHGTLIYSVSTTLRETESEFLENIYYTLYNLHHLQDHHHNMKLDKDVHPSIVDEKLKATYDLVYDQYRYKYLPHNINLNTAFHDIYYSNNNTEFVKNFPTFYEQYLLQKYSSTITEKPILSLKFNDLDENYLRKFGQLWRDNVTIHHLTIERNLKDYNFPKRLSTSEKVQLDDKIIELIEKWNNSVIQQDDKLTKDEHTKIYHTEGRTISLSLFDENIFTFGLHIQTISGRENKIEYVAKYFKFFHKFSEFLHRNGFDYLYDDRFGYITNQIAHTGTGINFEIDVKDKDNLQLTEYSLDKNIGFQMNEYSDNVSVQCSLNPVFSVEHMLEEFDSFLKNVKVTTHTETTHQEAHHGSHVTGHRTIGEQTHQEDSEQKVEEDEDIIVS